MKERKDIEEKYKWDLSILCKDDREFYDKIEVLKSYIPKFTAFRGKLANKEVLKEYFALSREFDDIFSSTYLYAYIKSDEILSDNERTMLIETADKFESDYSMETAFITNELNEFSDEFLDELIADADFKDQDLIFKEIKRTRNHILSEKEEKLLAGMDFLHTFSSNMRKLTDADFDFGEVEDGKGNKIALNHGNRGKLMISPDRVLRKNVSEKTLKIYADHKNVLANNYIGNVKATCYMAKIRNYSSALACSLENDEIEEKVYTSLIENVRNNIPLINRFYDLKRRELGLDEIYGYDVLVEEIANTPTRQYTYESAIEEIKKALAPLGEEYIAGIDEMVKNRRVDVFPNKDKRTGGYCTVIGKAPSFILYNFDGNLSDTIGLAHEFGHAMHTYYSAKFQPAEKDGHATFLAEIASTTNEILFFNYLLKISNSQEEKRAILNKLFIEVDAAIFSQTKLAEFEEKVHAMCEEGKPLSRDVLSDVFDGLQKDYGGTIKRSENSKYSWSRIPHLYSDFYVFCYATGMIAAIAFANNILSGKEGALEGYYSFLKAGSSATPTTILKNAGCDMLSQETFKSCFEYLNSLLDEWENLIKK